MATWHQQKAGLVKVPDKGYVIESDGYHQLRSFICHGENEEQARICLGNYRKNQPNMTHRLYYNGKCIE